MFKAQRLCTAALNSVLLVDYVNKYYCYLWATLSEEGKFHTHQKTFKVYIYCRFHSDYEHAAMTTGLESD